MRASYGVLRSKLIGLAKAFDYDVGHEDDPET